MLPKEVTQFIGQVRGKSIFVVQEEAIRRFADAVDDLNPLFWDEEYAKKSKYGAIIAPPGFISSPWYSSRPTKWGKKVVASGGGMAELRPALEKAGFKNPGAVDAGIEYDFFFPVKAGDVITAVAITKDIIEREGKTGKMAFVVTETTYTNQKGEVVAKARGTVIQR